MTEQEFSIAIGAKIQQARLRRNLTQVELADKCDMESSSIARIEAGRRNIKLYTYYRICSALNISPDEILNDFK